MQQMRLRAFIDSTVPAPFKASARAGVEGDNTFKPKGRVSIPVLTRQRHRPMTHRVLAGHAMILNPDTVGIWKIGFASLAEPEKH